MSLTLVRFLSRRNFYLREFFESMRKNIKANCHIINGHWLQAGTIYRSNQFTSVQAQFDLDPSGFNLNNLELALIRMGVFSIILVLGFIRP